VTDLSSTRMHFKYSFLVCLRVDRRPTKLN